MNFVDKDFRPFYATQHITESLLDVGRLGRDLRWKYFEGGLALMYNKKHLSINDLEIFGLKVIQRNPISDGHGYLERLF